MQTGQDRRNLTSRVVPYLQAALDLVSRSVDALWKFEVSNVIRAARLANDRCIGDPVVHFVPLTPMLD